MTQIEREELVERYLSGSLSPSEEGDFFLHVAVDDELQRTLKAHRVIEQTVQRDREVAVPERGAYRENIMMMLAATPVAAGAAAAAGGKGIASGGSLSGGLGAFKMMAITLLAGSLTVGTVAIVTSHDSAPKHNPPAATSTYQRPAERVDSSATMMRADTMAAPIEEAKSETATEPNGVMRQDVRDERRHALSDKEGARPSTNPRKPYKPNYTRVEGDDEKPLVKTRVAP